MSTLLSILGFIIAALTFYYNFQKNPKKEIFKLKEAVLVQFRANKKISIELRSYLEKYSTITNSHNEFINPQYTYSQYIKHLENSQQTNLSEDLFNQVKDTQYDNRHILESMLESLQLQYKNLDLSLNTIKIKLYNTQ